MSFINKQISLFFAVVLFAYAIHGQMPVELLNEQNFLKSVVKLNSVEPKSTNEDFHKLTKYLINKQIIGVGEASHGTSEFYKLRHRLFKYGVEKWNLKVLSVEVHFGSAGFLNDYVRTGEGNLTEILKNSGYWIYTTEEFAALVEWMKDYNKGKSEKNQLKIYGFDSQLQGSVNSVNRLKTYFEKTNASYLPTFNQLTSFIYNGFPEFRNFKTQQEAADNAPKISKDYQEKINQIIAFLKKNKSEFEAKSGEKPFQLALQQAEVLLLGTKQSGITNRDDVIEFRDIYMANNIKWISEFENNGKVMALAHNGHIQKDETMGIKRNIKWMGRHLQQLYKDKYYALGFIFNEGSLRAVNVKNGAKEVFTVTPNPNSLTGVLAALKTPLFFMNLATVNKKPKVKAVIDKEYWFYNAAAVYEKESNAGAIYNLAKSYDGVIFVEKTTGTKPLP